MFHNVELTYVDLDGKDSGSIYVNPAQVCHFRQTGDFTSIAMAYPIEIRVREKADALSTIFHDAQIVGYQFGGTI